MNNEELMVENAKLKAHIDILMNDLHNRGLLEMELVRQLNELVIYKYTKEKEKTND